MAPNLSRKEKIALIRTELIADAARSDRKIARALGFNHVTIGKVRQRMAEEGIVPFVTQADRVSDRGIVGDGITVRYILAPDSKAGSRVGVPDGLLLVDFIRTGFPLEKEGLNSDEVAKRLGIAETTYRQARAVILLSEHAGMNTADAALVKKAIGLLNETRRTQAAFSLVKHLVERMWGGKKMPYSERSAEKRIEAFQTAIAIISATCSNSRKLKIPLLQKADAEEAITQVTEAIGALRQLCATIRRLS